jgi:hypothetical protein
MEKIIGYTVHFLKKVGEPTVADFNSEMMEQNLEIEQKLIPLTLKDSFEDFIKSIGNKVPLEDEFNQWYSKQNQN